MTDHAHYTVLARRFRPQAFGEVVGQEHVAQALTNAIRSNRVAHAYLFTGARGVGKTSTARILAKALNCPNVQDGVPCNHCEICEGISAGNDVDVLEIDGASHRGIDDIRSLRANVGVRSMRTRFKLYIIDEVHMLTREAFNALLKTLEEPPPNVKFVFCTTEPNKVPDTILSRCQRFDFSAIGEQSIGTRLKEIAAAEGFQVDDEAVELVARRARGSMRDSQSLFDQLLAFSDGTVSANDVHRMLGTAGDDLLVSLFAAVAENRPGEVLSLLEGALNAGVQTGELLDQCVTYVRDLMVMAGGGTTLPLYSVGSAQREAVSQQSQQMGLSNIMAAFQILSETKSRMFRSTFARVLLEMALLQISMLENLSAISALLSGELPKLPEPAAGGESESVKSSSVTTDAAQKKNPELGGPPLPEPPDSSASAAKLLEFCAANAETMRTELIAKAGFALAGALRSTESFAISAPNRLEILLAENYDFQRRLLEQSENRVWIRSAVEDLTGIDVVPEIRIIKRSVPPAAAESPKSTSETKSRQSPKPAAVRNDPAQVKAPPQLRVRTDVDPENDPFVQQVVSSFSAKVVRITDAPVRPSQEGGTDGVTENEGDDGGSEDV